MKLQDCFVGQNVEVNSKSMGILTGTILSLFEDEDIMNESIAYAVVNTEQLDQTVEVPISRLLGVVNKVKNELLEKNLCKGLTNTQIKRMLSAFVNII